MHTPGPWPVRAEHIPQRAEAIPAWTIVAGAGRGHPATGRRNPPPARTLEQQERQISQMRPLTSSEMRDWQTCQRGWWLKHYRCLRPQGFMPSLPNIGTLVHLGLETYYDNSGDPLVVVAERGKEIIEQYPEYAEQVLKDVELALIMLDGYPQWLEESGADIGLEPVGAEVKVEAAVGPYMLRGKIDTRLRREFDGALLQLENKTVQNLTDLPKYAQSAPQFLTYDLLAYLTRPDGVQTDGVLLNMLRRVKRTASAKPPFYGRHEVRHNIEELKAHYYHIIGIGQQIEHARGRLDNGEDPHIVCPPAVDRNHTWLCDCHEITTMIDDGSDWEGYLEEFWEAYDPLERYEEVANEGSG